jgi:hypothetical protein
MTARAGRSAVQGAVEWREGGREGGTKCPVWANFLKKLYLLWIVYISVQNVERPSANTVYFLSSSIA